MLIVPAMVCELQLENETHAAELLRGGEAWGLSR
jgi:hypothetical protein